MTRKSLSTVAFAALLALGLAPTPAAASSPWLSGSCLPQPNPDPGPDCLASVLNRTCSLETRYRDEDNVVQNLCNDGKDNDCNGYIDGDDPHCQSEVLCQDGYDNDGDGLTDLVAGTPDLADCGCLKAVSGIQNPACVANDFAVSYTTANSIVEDGCINSSDLIEVALKATATAAQPDRYDLGLWVALAGGDAKLGTLCTRQILQPVANTTVGATPDPTDPLGDGPFRSEETKPAEIDRCGDGGTAGSVSVYQFPYTVLVSCSDVTLDGSLQNGFIDIGQCGSWDQHSGSICNNPSQAVPGTGSKCSCARSDTNIPGPNVRTACTNFTPSGADYSDGDLDPGQSVDFTFAFSNSVTNCAPGSPTLNDANFGLSRCGTVGFLRFTIPYGAADTIGTFYYQTALNVFAPVPTCTATGVAYPNNGLICNDTANNRLIWAPRDSTNTNNTVWGVVGPNPPTSPITLPLRYTLDLNQIAITSLHFDALTYWDDHVYTTDPMVSYPLDPIEAVNLTGAVLQGTTQRPCTDCACDTDITVTPVTLASFASTLSGRSVRFEWSTETEVGNVGFDLYAIVGGDKRKLNDEPIPTASIDSLEPQSYEATFAVPDGAEAFVLEDLDFKGRAKAHGPFAPGQRYGEKIVAELVDWSGVRREHGLGARDTAKNNVRLAGQARRTLRTPSGANTSPLGTVELLVDRTGLHRVTYEQMLAAGIDVAGQFGNGMGLTSRGEPVPIYVSTGGKFGPGAYFEFWGEALDTLYTDTNVYRLDFGLKKAARVVNDTTTPAGAAAATYVETRRFERDRGYAFWSPNGDPFFDTEMLTFSTPKSWSFPFTIDGYVAGGGPATLRASLFGGSSFAQIALDHHVQVQLNGVQIGEAKFDGMRGFAFEAEIPAGLLADGANTLVLRMPGVPGAVYDLVSLDAFEVSYPRQFVAESGSLDFRAAGERFDVAGLADAAVVAYSRSGGTVRRLGGLTVTPDGAGFLASLPGSATGADYRVAGAGALLAPAAIQPARPFTDITTGPASYLVIAHAAFLDGVQPLVAARTAQGFTTKVVDVEDVYAQFAGGVYDARAIGDYIAYAYASMGTRYVLIVGGDTYDYRNFLGLAPVSFVPSLYRETSETVRFAPSDSAYADVDGDGRQDLAIGRIPARTTGQLANAVAKTLEYDARTYLTTATLAADYVDASANESFAASSNRLFGLLPIDWTVDRIYLDQTALATARTSLFADFAAGANLISYVGHSGPQSWGSSLKPVSQHLFKLTDIASLTNAGKPTVVSQLGCWNTYYASPVTEALGPRLLLTANKGAAAVLGAATLTQDANGNRFGALLTPRLVTPGATIGDAVWQAKRDLFEAALPVDDFRDILLGWTLLGDPALKIVP